MTAERESMTLQEMGAPALGATAQRARRYVETERTWSNSVARYRDVYARLMDRVGSDRDEGRGRGE